MTRFRTGQYAWWEEEDQGEGKGEEHEDQDKRVEQGKEKVPDAGGGVGCVS